MKRISILTVFLSTLFFSCGEEENLPEINEIINEEQPSQETVNELNFYDKYCFGFLVNDTVNLTVMGMRDDFDDVLLFGIQRKKLWISKFDRETKKCTKEYYKR